MIEHLRLFGEPTSTASPISGYLVLGPHLRHGHGPTYAKGCRCLACRRFAAERHQRNVKRWNERKSGPCVDCGGTFAPEAMEFDHLPGTDKRFTPGTMKGLRRSVVDAELAKCELVCANCHAVRTRQRLMDAQARRLGYGS